MMISLKTVLLLTGLCKDFFNYQDGISDRFGQIGQCEESFLLEKTTPKHQASNQGPFNYPANHLTILHT